VFLISSPVLIGGRAVWMGACYELSILAERRSARAQAGAFGISVSSSSRMLR